MLNNLCVFGAGFGARLWEGRLMRIQSQARFTARERLRGRLIGRPLAYARGTAPILSGSI